MSDLFFRVLVSERVCLSVMINPSPSDNPTGDSVWFGVPTWVEPKDDARAGTRHSPPQVSLVYPVSLRNVADPGSARYGGFTVRRIFWIFAIRDKFLSLTRLSEADVYFRRFSSHLRR